MIDYRKILMTFYPNALWSMNGDEYSGIVWSDSNATPMPTQSELDAQWIATEEAQAKEVCKREASQLLYATDWTTIPDVANPANNPYLMNQSDFIAYRNSVRQLAVNPVVNPVFPVKPAEQWSS